MFQAVISAQQMARLWLTISAFAGNALRYIYSVEMSLQKWQQRRIALFN
jgi:hypothetical protein